MNIVAGIGGALFFASGIAWLVVWLAQIDAAEAPFGQPTPAANVAHERVRLGFGAAAVVGAILLFGGMVFQ